MTAQKNLERLRMFFRFCVDREWITNNPAAKLKVKVQVKEKDPFGSEEWRRIKDAVFIYQDGHGRLGQANAEELLAFILVLRHSGLRISDAVKLERSQLVPSSNHDGFGLSVFQQKVQRTVYIPLPDGRHETDDVVAALRALPTKSERYFFWTGNGGLDTACTNWRARLTRLFKLAESSTGSRKPFAHRPHPHRFRHSFAAGYLLAGMPLKAVSLLLGHANTKVTEKHYAKFTLDQQKQLEDLTRQAWAAQAPKLQVIRGSKKKFG
jgi:integrase/recombinase XerD